MNFNAVSYQQLSETWSDIRHEWAAEKKSVLWKDFLQHIGLYISIGEAMIEVSEKTKLYMANQKMIRDLSKSYEQDAEAVFNYIQARITEKLREERWRLNFQSKRGWQQYYLEMSLPFWKTLMRKLLATMILRQNKARESPNYRESDRVPRH